MDTWIDYKLQFAWENFTSIYNIYIIYVQKFTQVYIDVLDVILGTDMIIDRYISLLKHILTFQIGILLLNRQKQIGKY